MIFFIPKQQTKIVFIRKKSLAYKTNEFNLKKVSVLRLSHIQTLDTT